jgi:predicted transcriptional regulator
MDLIDMSVGKLLNRTAQTIINNLDDVVEKNYVNESNGTYPR